MFDDPMFKGFTTLEDNSSDPLTLVWCTNLNDGGKSNYLAFYFINGGQPQWGRKVSYSKYMNKDLLM